MMREETVVANRDKSSARLDARYQLLFGTEKIYQFLRLYSLLCTLLTEVREHFAKHPHVENPADAYITQLKSGKKRKRRKAAANRKVDFFGLLLALKKVLAHESSARDFEALARRSSKAKVHIMATLPVLIDRSVEALVKMAEEDALLQLYDYCQYKNADPVAVRSQCMAIVPDVFYRIQFEASTGVLSCCYLYNGPLLTSPEDDDMDEADDLDEMVNNKMDTTGGELDDDPIDEFDERDNVPQPEAKRSRLE